MNKLILISAKAQNGKDTTADILISKLNGKSTKVALARDLKLICQEYLVWDGTKSEEGREILQKIGTDKIRKDMKWDVFHAHRTYETIKIIEDYYDYIFVCDVRFKNELNYLAAMFPDKIVSIRVNRLNFQSPLTKDQQLHDSETNLDGYNKFDYYINSESGLDNLEREIDKTFNGVLYELSNKLLDDLKVGDKVKVTKILNINRAEHLERFINKEGFVFSWIVKGYAGEKRYKVFFDDIDGIENLNETAYFVRQELQFLEG